VNKAIIAVAVEEDGRKIGRVRLQTIQNLTRTVLHGFIVASVESGNTVRTDGFKSYLGLDGYVHQRHVQTEQPEEEHVLPRVHRVIGLLKRWLMGTHQGAVSAEHLDDYLDEFTIRLDPEDIAIARVQAAERGLRYQTYLKMIIHEALRKTA
jgi:transposase-like protein